jgi:acyl transferase domain-containing protein/acyl carrier protein
VSSFGISGTNAHLILEQAPHTEPPAAADWADPGLLVWPLSGRTPEAVRDAAARLDQWLDDRPDADPVRVGYSLATTRTQFEHRAVLTGTGDQVRAGLAALAAGQPHPAVVTGTVPPGGARPVLVFPGQGSQWPGMAADLLASSPVFAAMIRECTDALAPHTGWDLHDILTADPARPAADLHSPAVIQPVLWAVMTALARLWRHHGIEPAAVAGHSQGEIAAATIAGVLSLDEAAALVAARSAVIAALAPPGAMASLAASQDTAAALIAGYGEQLIIATINSPAHTVISGDPAAVDDLVTRAAADGITARKLPVSYASHHPALDAIRDQLIAALPPLTPRETQIPFYSAVTGTRIDTTMMDAAYWYDNLRQPVQFSQAITTALANGHRLFIEASPHPVLTPAITAIIDAAALPAAATGTLRRDQPGPAELSAAIATAHSHGATPDWDTLYPPGTPAIALPTYPFQRQSYWLHTSAGPGDLPAAGLDPAGHPLLAAATAMPDGTIVLTGRLTASTAPWLPDHTILGTIILPGTALASLAAHAATLAGTPHLAELTLQAPLILPPDGGGLRLQVTAGASGPDGHRALAIHTRPAIPDTGQDQPWTCHATGTATPTPGQDQDQDQDWDWATGTWPPPGSQPVSLDGLYDRLASTGLDYGPAFQGLTAAWQRGGHLYAEATLPDGTDSDGYPIHPALLDAALHAAALTAPPDASVRLPFSFTGLDTYPATASVTTLRVRLTTSPDGTVALAAATVDGAPAAAITTLATRPVTAAQLTGPAQSSLHELSWVTIQGGGQALPGPVILIGAGPAARSLAQALEAAGTSVTAYQEMGELKPDSPVPGLILAGPPPTQDGTTVPAAAATAVRDTLALLQAYLASPRLASTALAWITTGVAGPGPATDLPATATSGLVRSAQIEHPGRIIHLDLDPEATGTTDGSAALAAALAAAEPHIAVRDGVLLAPRLTRSTRHVQDEASTALDPDGTVLITGGGTLGSIIARHLAATGQARHLLLLSRRGPDAPGADQLAEDLEAAGAEAVIAACDVTSRPDLEGALAAIPAGHPLTAVIHTAGTTSDATITTMDPAQIDSVLAPKTAAWHLHQLTAELPLAAFVLFSSVAGQLGSPGQGNYAAANAFLDALATWRHAHGLPALSLAWGLWAEESGITAGITGEDHARLARNGITPMPTPTALAAYDSALTAGRTLLIPATFSTTAVASQAQAGLLPPLLRDIVRTPDTRRQSAGQSLAKRLAGRNESEQRQLILSVVRENIAAVLGYDSPALIDPERAFQDMGFDSLTAIELRNRLAGVTGLRLPAVMVFDHPSATAIAEYLRDRLGPTDPDGHSAILAELDRLEAALSALATEELDDPAVKGRLRTLTAKWTGNGHLPDADVDGQLQNASAEEVLDFIDRELRGT